MGANTASLSQLILMSTGASAAANMAGSFTQASALRSQGRYEGSMLDRNAQFARGNAAEAAALGDEEALRYGRDIRQLQGQQRAAAVSQGLEPGTGTGQEIIDETGRLGALDMLTIRNNAARQAFGYDVQAAEYGSAARMARMQGKAQARDTLITGGLKSLREAAGGYAAAKAAKPNPRMLPTPWGFMKNPNYRKY